MQIRITSNRYRAAFVCLLGAVAVGLLLGARPRTPSREVPARVGNSDSVNDLWTVSGLKREIARRKAEARCLRESGYKGPIKQATGWLEARLWYLEQRAFPYDFIDWRIWQRAAEHRDRMPAADFGGVGDVGQQHIGSRWSFVGPTDLSAPYRRYFGPSPIAGRVNAVAFDPVDPDTYWVGGPGGLFKSTDAGVTWRALSDRFPVVSVSSIAVHPTNPDIVYVGTGDFDGAAPYGCGLMKTTNGGLSWTNMLGGGIGTAAISAIVIDPDNPNIVNICTGRGGSRGFVYRSTNGGANWTITLTVDAEWSDMDVSLPDDSGNRVYYVTGHSATGEFFRSTDRGATWTAGSSPLIAVNQNALELAASPVFANRVFLVSGRDRKIWVNDSFGLGQWSEFTSGLPSSHDGNPTYNWSQSGYDIHLTASRSGNTEMIYLGLITLARADIQDGSWKWVNVGNTYSDKALTHNDQHCMAVHPNDPNLMLVGNDGGVYRLLFKPSNRTSSFTSLNKNLRMTQFYHMDAHPTDPERLLGGTQDNASPAATGNLGDWGNPGSGDGGFCVIHPKNGNLQYVTSQFFGSIYRTTNGWGSRKKIATTGTFGKDNIAFIAPIAADPNEPRILYAGTNYLNAYLTTGQFGVWKKHLGNKKLAHDILRPDGSIAVKGKITAIAVAPSDSKRIYTGANTGEIFMTKDGAKTWTSISDTPLPTAMVTSITVHPTVPNILFVTYASTGISHVWRCDNAGSAPVWNDISGAGATGLPDVPALDIELDPDDPTSTYYVATDVGVFYTTNFGFDWANATAPLGLPNVAVGDLKAIPGTRTLYAATFGRGMWKINMPETLTPEYISAPAVIAGGASAKGEVGINGPAPFIGTVVNLASNHAAATVPSSVKVPFGSLSALFDIDTSPVTTTRKVTLSASRGGVTKQVQINVNPAVKSVTPVPSPITGGLTGEVHVLLDGPSLIDVSVGVSTDNPAVAQIVNASGTPITKFTIQGDPVTGDRGTVFVKTSPVTTATDVTIFARYGGIQKSAVLRVVPPKPLSVTFSPATVTGGTSSTGKVTLEAAPAVDTTVTLTVTAGSSAVKSLPGSIVVAAGTTSRTFTIQTKAVASSTTVSVRATANGGNATGNLTVKTDVVPASLTFNPNPVAGSFRTTGRVTLSGAPAVDTVVTLRVISGGHALATGSPPSSVTVKAGTTFVEFPINTVGVPTDTEVIIEATANGASVTGTLIVTIFIG